MPGDRIRVLYIAGVGSSGSTLLSRALASAPGAISPGELRTFWTRGALVDELCDCGRSFSACEFWAATFETDGLRGARSAARELAGSYVRMQWLPNALRLRRHGQSPDRLRQTERHYVQRTAAVYQAVAKISGARLLVDASKSAAYGLMLSAIPSLDVRVLHLVRDSRAVAFSHLRRRIADPVPPSTERLRQIVGQSTSRWTRINLYASLFSAFGVPYLRLRYEDFCRNPVAALARIERFAGQSLAGCLGADGRSVRLSAGHALSGNPLRFQTADVPVRLDDEWQSRLDPAHRRAATAMSLPLLLHYGYVPWLR